MKKEKFIFHVDVNSAFLSWEAVARLQHGEKTDLRTIPSAIGGDPVKRSGIILAASKPAKKLGVRTAQVLHEAFLQCPNLKVFPPDYHLYMRCSEAMVSILRTYSPLVQKFSVDECFLDMNDFSYTRQEAIDIAYKIKNQIEDQLGFTVNVGIGYNKITAKMASELEKPNKVHTMFPEEIESKLWPLEVGELFGVGHSSKVKLNAIGVETIGDLANMSIDILKYKFKSYGQVIKNYANGIESSEVRNFSGYEKIKSIGNSTTIKFDVTEADDAYKVLLSLTEMVASRLRSEGFLTQLVSVSIRYASLGHVSHQRKLFHYTDQTMQIYKIVEELFNDLWNKEAIRHLGVRVSKFHSNVSYQYSIFDEDIDKHRKLESVVDALRIKYGKNILTRAGFLHSGFSAMSGGVSDEKYTDMISSL